MKRKRYLAALTAAAACAAVLTVGSACGEKSKNELAFDVAATAEATYGTYFEVPEVVGTDSNGKFYFPDILVSDADGDAVIYEDGKFFVAEMSDYTVSYTIVFEEEDLVKTTLIKVFDKVAPSISLEKEQDIAPLGEYGIPQPQIEDDYDSAENIEITVSVSDENGEVQIDAQNNCFTMSEAGEYKITYTAEDRAGNSSTAVMTVSAVDETDCVTYFHHPLGGEGIINAGYAANGGITQDYTFGEDAYSYGVSFNTNTFNADGPYVTVDIMTPYIKDITPYRYMYFYVYSSAVDISLGMNNTFLANPNIIEAGQPKRVYIERTSDGKDFLYMGTKLFTADEFSRIKTPTDITGFRIVASTSESLNPDYAGSGLGTVYFSSVRVADSIPLAEVTLEASRAFTGESVAIPEASGSGFAAISQKVYYSVNGGEYTEISGESFIPQEPGTYSLRFDVYDGNIFTDSLYKTLTVISAEEKEEDVVMYLHKDFGADSLETSNFTASVTDEFSYGNEGKSTKFMPSDDAFGAFQNSSVINGHFRFKAPAIEDISSYKYLYFYVYAPNVSLRIYANNGSATVWDGYETVEKGLWKRIVVTNVEGNWWFASNAQFASKNQAEDITGFGFNLYILYEGNESAATGATFGGIFVSAIRVANEIPQANVAFASATVEEGVPMDIPVAEHSGFTDFSQEVYYSMNGGDYTKLSGTSFTPERGNYTFRFDVYDGENFIDSIYKTLVVTEKSDDVVLPFHLAGGSASVTAENFTLSSSQEQTFGDEEYSVKLTPTDDAFGAFQTNGVINGNFKIKDPLIRDISEYKYLYFYVYAPNVDLRVYANNGATLWDEYISVEKGNWTRVTVTNVNGTWWFASNTNFIQSTQASDITDMGFNIYILYEGNESASTGATFGGVYISAVRVTNELPA